MSEKKPKVIVIVGPTASGKSRLAIDLARSFGGEIVSADSRQVYRGMDIGTGKVTKAERRQVPHHLLDVASPRSTYTAGRFVRDGRKAIAAIRRRGHIPLICGGTGFWIEALLGTISLPPIEPNRKLRTELSLLTTQSLFARLKKRDPVRSRTIDPENRRRLIRALEIVLRTGKPVPPVTKHEQYDSVFIGISPPTAVLRRNIRKRLAQRLRRGMVAEVKRLLQKGVSAERLASFGLEYRYVTAHLKGTLSRAELENVLFREITAYAKRQMTWLRSAERKHPIHWVQSRKEAEKIIKEFLKDSEDLPERRYARRSPPTASWF